MLAAGDQPCCRKTPHLPRAPGDQRPSLAPGSLWHSLRQLGQGRTSWTRRDGRRSPCRSRAPINLEWGGRAIGHRPSSSTSSFTRDLAGRGMVRAGQREGTVQRSLPQSLQHVLPASARRTARDEVAETTSGQVTQKRLFLLSLGFKKPFF